MSEVNGRTVCKTNMCSGCHVCADICPRSAVKIVDSLEYYNAVIDTKSCINCGLCERICPNNIPPKKLPIKYSYQGWAKNSEIRERSSSGGIATALAQSFVNNGGVVCSCTFKNGEFVFDFAETVEDTAKFVGSKYVKSNPTGAYALVKNYVKNGRSVLFIGLPCQVAAMKNWVGDSERLYTVDLICHGTPSPKLLDAFLLERGYAKTELSDISFRDCNEFRLAVNGSRTEPETVRDRYTHSFLRGICYTENCYSCQYTTNERVSDITLGDSWGSMLPKEEIERGISLVLCMTDRGRDILLSSDVHLEDVDMELAIQNNRQLKEPTAQPEQRRLFFNSMAKRGGFSSSVMRCYPRFCIKQKMKSILIKAGLRRG